MTTKPSKREGVWSDGWHAGYHAATLDLKTDVPQTQQQFYDLNPHDLDTLALGIGLIVLHAADIQTIEATIDTQQKLGLGVKVLGWLHMICEPPQLDDERVILHETDSYPWLNSYALPKTDDDEREPRLRDWSIDGTDDSIQEGNDDLSS